MNELEHKLDQIDKLLDQHGLDGLLLQSAGSFAWVTCGASSYINTASTNGLAAVLITPDGRYVITTNIEAPRIANEEGLADQGWEVVAEPWHGAQQALADLTAGLKLGADGPVPGAVNLAGQIARVRITLTPQEVERMRALGGICAEAMDTAIRNVRPGYSEQEIAALLAYETQRRGAQAIVNLIATDERIFRFRHPLPTDKRLDKYAMLVLCGRRQGLICSITRLVHFGPLPDELKIKQEATAKVDATFIAGTRPGRTLGAIFADAQAAYAAAGFPDEWQLHHQGGPVGYEPRESIGVPGSPDVVKANQAYAWNPSITGAKFEDTILVGESDNEVLTTIAGWPMLTVEAGGKPMARPAILELD